jgi:hypothetical protein
VIPVRRLQQAVFASALATNRFAGSGGGSGLTFNLIGFTTFSSGSGTITGSGTWQDDSHTKTTFTLGRPATVLVFGLTSAGATNVGQNLLVNISIDGGGGSTSQGQSAIAPAGNNIPSVTVLAFALLQPGVHTASLTYQLINPQTYSYSLSGVYVIQLG